MIIGAAGTAAAVTRSPGEAADYTALFTAGITYFAAIFIAWAVEARAALAKHQISRFDAGLVLIEVFAGLLLSLAGLQWGGETAPENLRLGVVVLGIVTAVSVVWVLLEGFKKPDGGIQTIGRLNSERVDRMRRNNRRRRHADAPVSKKPDSAEWAVSSTRKPDGGLSLG